MGGSWGKEQELEIIKSGGIHYKQADIHEVSVNIIGATAILLSKITLLAVVGGNDGHQSLHGDRSVCAARWQLEVSLALIHPLAYPGAEPLTAEL